MSALNNNHSDSCMIEYPMERINLERKKTWLKHNFCKTISPNTHTHVNTIAKKYPSRLLGVFGHIEKQKTISDD